jgi:ABC-type transporter Mla subunit MlaD
VEPVEILLVVFVGVSAAAFIVQSVAMWRAFQTLRGATQRLQAQSEGLQKDLQEIAARLRETVDSLKPLGHMAEETGAQLQEVLRMGRSRAEDVDSFLKDMVQVGREQAAKLDYVVTDTVQKFEQTTEIIKRDILRPAVEISAFFKGVKSGLEYLFAKRRPSAEPETPEEESPLF